MIANRSRIVHFGIAAIAAVALSGGLLLAGQDPAVVNSKIITVKLENDRVRVLEAKIAPGEKEQPHSHPASIIYVIDGGTMRNHAADGTVSDTTYKAGDTISRQAITRHWAENIGSTTVRLVLVELKQ